MTPQEAAIYDAHDHDVRKYGQFAGSCCMEALQRIEEARERARRMPTLFDVEAYA